MSGATTAEINAALRLRYCAPEWVAAFEVAESTGGGTRRADCVAMNCYNSRGLEIHGIEVKISRGDWVRELKNPDKAEQGVFRFCDAWYIAAPAGMIAPTELPPRWGLLEYSAGTLRQKVKAGPLESTVEGGARSFMASFLRRVGGADQPTLNEVISRAQANARQGYEDHIQQEKARFDERLKEYADVAGLLERYGLRGVRWTNEREIRQVAEFVHLARSLTPEQRHGQIMQARQSLINVREQLTAAISGMERMADVLDAPAVALEPA